MVDHHALIKEQAAIWLIRISDNSLKPEDVEALREWVGRSDFHRDYFIQLSQNWDDMAVLQELGLLFAVPRAGFLSKARQGWLQLTGRFSVPGYALGASLLVCTLALLLAMPALDSRTMTLQTAIGEQRIERLEDGTLLTLNTDSELRVDYRGDNRIVRLSRGEVNFDVAKNPHRPFVVYAGDGLVWAVGTAFNVRLLDERGVDLTVTEGRVKVYAGLAPSAPLPSLDASDATINNSGLSLANNEAFVKAGEVLQYSQVIAQKDEVLADQLKNKLAWQQGALIFKGETLERALSEIGRYTDKELRITDPAIKDRKIGGHYKTDDIDSLLRSISQSFGLQLTYLESGAVHLSSK